MTCRSSVVVAVLGAAPFVGAIIVGVLTREPACDGLAAARNADLDLDRRLFACQVEARRDSPTPDVCREVAGLVLSDIARRAPADYFVCGDARAALDMAPLDHPQRGRVIDLCWPGDSRSLDGGRP